MVPGRSKTWKQDRAWHVGRTERLQDSRSLGGKEIQTKTNREGHISRVLVNYIDEFQHYNY